MDSLVWSNSADVDQNVENVFELLRCNTVGGNAYFDTPLGKRRLVYADWTASGRALKQVEEYIYSSVLPFYGNTHSETSMTGVHTTSLRESARDMILEAVHGDKNRDIVMFCGSGATAAVNDFIKLIEFERYCLAAQSHRRPLVLVSGYEHHSNFLPWREAGADMIEIRESPITGAVDIDHLEQVLRANNTRRDLIIGSFSAGSNVTGVCTDVGAVANALHKYGALACFDYACVGPYTKIRMSGVSQGEDGSVLDSYLDAVFVSPHKFIGGVGSTGVLIAKKNLLTKIIPVMPGGGTVLYVTSHKHKYLDDVTHREEAGTPNIIGNIRAGLAFKIQSDCGADNIHQKEDAIVKQIRSPLAASPNIVLLGPPINLETARRVPILSFVIKCGERYLHHSFVTAVLNDVYGIQSRSGCMCAGPYSIRLFGTADKVTNRVLNLLHDEQYLKPGFVRLSLVYLNSPAEISFILSAIREVSEHGWKLLPQYKFDVSTSAWYHQSSDRISCLPSIRQFSLSKGVVAGSQSNIDVSDTTLDERQYYQSVLAESGALYASCYSTYKEDARYVSDTIDYESDLYSGDNAEFSWFVFPKDVVSAAVASEDAASWALPSYSSAAIIRPERYWPSVQTEFSGIPGDRSTERSIGCFHFLPFWSREV